MATVNGKPVNDVVLTGTFGNDVILGDNDNENIKPLLGNDGGGEAEVQMIS